MIETVTQLAGGVAMGYYGLGLVQYAWTKVRTQMEVTALKAMLHD